MTQEAHAAPEDVLRRAAAETLDEAWSAAELMLGEYWRVRSLVEVPRGWEAVATDGNRIRSASGSTPLAALNRLGQSR